MPEQQPQRQSEVPLQLTRSSLSPLHDQRQLTVVGEAAIVVQARDLERAKRNHTLAQVNRRRNTLRLEDGGDDAGHTGDLAGSGIDGAKVDRLSEGKGVGIEEPLLSVRQALTSQHLRERPFDIGLRK